VQLRPGGVVEADPDAVPAAEVDDCVVIPIAVEIADGNMDRRQVVQLDPTRIVQPDPSMLGRNHVDREERKAHRTICLDTAD